MPAIEEFPEGGIHQFTGEEKRALLIGLLSAVTGPLFELIVTTIRDKYRKRTSSTVSQYLSPVLIGINIVVSSSILLLINNNGRMF